MDADASIALLDTQLAAAIAAPDDDLIDDGLLLFYRAEPDPDLVWKAGAYDKNTLAMIRHESVMTDAAEVLLDLLRRCAGQLGSYDYRVAMRAHFDLVYPRASSENELDNIVREVEAKRATLLTVIEGGR